MCQYTLATNLTLYGNEGSFGGNVYTMYLYCMRAAERIGGAQGKYKKWGPTKWIVREVWGHAPRRFYML